MRAAGSRRRRPRREEATTCTCGFCVTATCLLAFVGIWLFGVKGLLWAPDTREAERLQRDVDATEKEVARLKEELTRLQRQEESLDAREQQQQQRMQRLQMQAQQQLPLAAQRNEEDLGGAAAGNNVFAAAGHPILGLSEAEFRSTPADVQMRWYKSESCDNDFGNGLIDRWRSAGQEWCRPNGQRIGDDKQGGSSSVTCHLVKQASHGGNGDNLCVMRNVSVSFAALAEPSSVKGIMTRYRDTKHAEEAYPKPKKGAVLAACQPVKEKWVDTLMPGWNADWTTRALEAVSAGTASCDTWVKGNVLLIQRHTFANFFHDSEDFVNALIAMAVLRWSSAKTQIWLTDLYPRGPFWPMWDKIFHGDAPPLLAWDIAQQFGSKKRVCFESLAVGIFGPAAPTTLAATPTKCRGTALVRAYSDFVIRGLGLQDKTRYTEAPSKQVVVTWMSRASSVPWPEARFCHAQGSANPAGGGAPEIEGDSGSFFTCDYFQHLGTRPLQRVVKNEADVVRALRKLEGAKYSNGAVVKFQSVDYNLLSFEEQIRTDLQTDIMIGPHGAGLFHNIFMPDRGVLIELWIDGTSGRKHFHNLANWYGRKYVGVAPTNPVPVGTAVDTVRSAIEGRVLTKH